MLPSAHASLTSSRATALLRSPAVALLLVMFAATLWATVGVASRLIPHDVSIPDEAYGFARTVVAGPVLLLFAWCCGGLASLRPRKGSLPGFLVFGLCCAIFQVGLFRSFSLLGVTITVFITVCLPPVIAVLWTMILHPGRLSRQVQVALVLAIIGLLAFSSRGFGSATASGLVEGLVLSIIASVAFVIMSNAARELAADHPPLLVAGLGLTLASVFLAGAVFAISPETWTDFSHVIWGWRTSGFLIYLGLVPTALAYLLYCTGMARCRTAAGGLVASMIEPAVAAGLAFLFLQEWLSLQELMGCLLLFGAMLVLWREEQRVRGATAPLPEGA